MRDHDDEDDPKQPHPVHTQQKHTNAPEAAEAVPWGHVRKDDDRDRHRHVRKDDHRDRHRHVC